MSRSLPVRRRYGWAGHAARRCTSVDAGRARGFGGGNEGDGGEGGERRFDLIGCEAGGVHQRQALRGERAGQLGGERVPLTLERQAQIVGQQGQIADQQDVRVGMRGALAGRGEPGGPAGGLRVRGAGRDVGQTPREAAKLPGDEPGQQRVDIGEIAAERRRLHVERADQAAGGERRATVSGEQGEADHEDAVQRFDLRAGRRAGGFFEGFGLLAKLALFDMHAGTLPRGRATRQRLFS